MVRSARSAAARISALIRKAPRVAGMNRFGSRRLSRATAHPETPKKARTSSSAQSAPSTPTVPENTRKAAVLPPPTTRVGIAAPRRTLASCSSMRELRCWLWVLARESYHKVSPRFSMGTLRCRPPLPETLATRHSALENRAPSPSPFLQGSIPVHGPLPDAPLVKCSASLFFGGVAAVRGGRKAGFGAQQSPPTQPRQCDEPHRTNCYQCGNAQDNRGGVEDRQRYGGKRDDRRPQVHQQHGAGMRVAELPQPVRSEERR